MNTRRKAPGEYIDPSGSEEAKFDKDDFDAKINFFMFFAYALGPDDLLDIDTPESRRKKVEAENAAYMAKLEADMNAMMMADHEAWMAAAIRLDIITTNAAKFGGVVHSTAAGMVNQAVVSGGPTGTSTFKVAENDSPRPADRVSFTYDFFGSGCDLDEGCGGEGFFDLFPGADGCVCPPNSNSDFYVNRHSKVQYKRGRYPWSRAPVKCALEPIGSALTQPRANPEQWVID